MKLRHLQCRYILWDLDGVLLDSYDKEGAIQWSKRLEEETGLPASLLPEIFDKRWHDAVCGKIREKDLIADIFARHHIAYDPGAFLAYWLSRDLRLRPSLLPYLARYPAAIASNQAYLRAQAIRNLFKETNLAFFFSCDIGAEKPDPAFYAFIEKKLGLSGDALCFIDDAPAYIEAAKKRGWQTHRFTNEENLAAFLEPAP